MPIPMSIDKQSSDEQIRKAIGACIRKMRREGRDPKQAVAICYSEARKKTGKQLGK